MPVRHYVYNAYGVLSGGILLHPLQDDKTYFYVELLSLFLKEGDFFMKIFSTKTLVTCSLLAALSIIFGKFLAIPVSDTLRFSFENTPLFLAGFTFGPIIGGTVALVADIVGSLLRGYAINPLITLGAVSIGVLGGLFFKALKNAPTFFRVLLPIIIAHIIGSLLIKTFGLSFMSGTPFTELFLMRTVNYLIIIPVDTLVIYFLYKNRSFNKLMESFR